MFTLTIEKSDKTKEKVKVYEPCDTFPFIEEEKLELVHKRSYKKGREHIEYLNVSMAFDIETTSFGEKGKKPYGIMYAWMFCECDRVILGRTWESFIEFYEKLVDFYNTKLNKRVVIYCHSLQFEFFWIKDFFNFVDVFAKDKHKIMKAVTADGVEFRCSYFLSNMSLAKFCENQGALFYKRSGEAFNYRKKRYPHTRQNNIELVYEYCDVRGLCECIDTLLLEDNIATIPLTNTGYVRRDFKQVMLTKKNIELFRNTALDVHLYDMCKDAFRGGDTHANRAYIGKLIDGAKSDDIESSYPFIMLFYKFPMGKFRKINVDSIKTESELNTYLNEYACLVDITFHNIETESPAPYIDFGHVKEKRNLSIDNGRVIKGEYIRLICTEQDVQIVREDYRMSGLTLNELWIAKKDFLPIEYRHKILDYARAKTSLKGISEKAYEYMKSKNRLNSSFGFLVSDICRDEWVYSDEEKNFLEDPIKCDKEKALSDYYDRRGNFLVYQWGVWVTAYARRRLRDFIQIVGEKRHLYNDTDAVKYRTCGDLSDIDAYKKKENERIIDMWKNAEKADPAFHIEDKNGTQHFLGIWDYDGEYDEFKTYGAKKYAIKYKKNIKEYEEHKETDGIVVTVSGLNKKNAAIEVYENGGIDRYFRRDTIFEKSGRTTAYYNIEKPEKKALDGHTYLCASNIAILDTTYTLNIGRDFDAFLKQIGLEIE